MPRNPFKNRSLALMFEAAFRAGCDNFSGHYVVTLRFGRYGPNVPRTGSADRWHFWNGYRGNPPRYINGSLAHAAYRAGEAFRRHCQRG